MNRIRGFGALVVLAGLIGGVLWLLVRYGDWPITTLPNAEWARRLTDTFVTDRAIFAVLTVAAWAVWATFTFSVLVEMSAALRGMQAPSIALAGPLQRLAGGLVATIVLAFSINHVASSAASALPAGVPFPRAVPATAVASPTPSLLSRTTLPASASALTVPRHASPAVPSPAGETVIVQRNDSSWSIAEQHLGDGMRWRELWELNRGVQQPDGRAWTDPQIILKGWELRLPGTATPDLATSPFGPAPQPTETYIVEHGDTLSEIAEDHLGDAARYREIFDLSRSIDQPGGRHLTDPNLILPGWTITIPSDEPPVLVPVAEEAPPAIAEPIVPTYPPPTTAVPPPVVPVSPPWTSQPAPTSTVPSSTAPAPSIAPPVSGKSSTSSSGTSVALIAALGSSLALASGLAIRIGVLRRRRGVRSARRLRATEARSADITSITRAADVPLMRWAGQEIAQLVGQLDPRRLAGGPLAVEISEEVGVEVLWSSAQQPAPDRWHVRDGGVSWRLPYDPEAPTPPDNLPAAIPALVTIGRREGRQLLIDLEAYGTVAVTGPAERVESFLRSVAVELSVSEEVADAFTQVVDVDLPGGPYERSRPATTEEALAHLTSAARSVRASLDAASVANSFLARAGHPIPIEANVAILRSLRSSDPVEIPTRLGVGLIVGERFDGAGCTIELREDGTARIEPLGIEFLPASLDADAAEALHEVIEELNDLVVAEHHESDDQVAISEPLPFEMALNEPERCTAVEPELLVKVLGVPHIPDRPDLGRRETIIAAVLACRGGPVASSFVQDCAWAGDSVSQKRVWNVIGETREALGYLADGSRVMPSSDRSKSRLLLDPRVTTDLALLRNAVRDAKEASSAEAIELLSTALSHVDGPPFDASGYDWAYTEQLVAEASSLIEEGTNALVDLALEADMLELCGDAVRRAMRSLPDAESLFRCQMRVEHAIGNTPGVCRSFVSLSAALREIGAEPADESVRLLRSLTAARPNGR